jgi:hypothetical protein
MTVILSLLPRVSHRSQPPVVHAPSRSARSTVLPAPLS